jgi:hypothetical protein
MGNIPRLARALEIPTTNYESCPASGAHSPQSCTHVHESPLTPPIDLTRRGDAGRAPAPPPALPLAPPGPTHVGKGGFGAPPMPS